MDVMDDTHLGRSEYQAPGALLEVEEEFGELVPPSQLRRARRRRWSEPMLNITSFVDVLSVLLFFLLSVATMEKLGTHDVNLPQQTEAFAKESTFDLKNLSLSLSREGLVLRGLVTVPDREPEALRVEWPTLEGRYDLVQLRDELLRIRAAYRTDGAIILMVSDDVNFDAVVKVMDTVRERVEYENGRRRVDALFPEISISDYLLEPVESEA